MSLSAENTGLFEVTALQTTEIDPPTGEKPMEWRLLANRFSDAFGPDQSG